MLLTYAHLGVSQMLSAPEIQLSKAEADGYTEAVSEFMRWHIPEFKADGKRGSEIGLIICMAMIYLPKGIAIVHRKNHGQQAPQDQSMQEQAH